MKKLHHFLLTALLLLGCALGANAQSQQAQTFFEKCSKEKFLTTVFVNKELLKTADNIDFSMMGVESIFDKLDVIGIVSAEQKNIVPKLAAIVKDSFDASVQNGNYKVIMTVTEGDEQTKILQLKHYDTERGKNEFVIVQREESEMTVVVICGKLSISDINKLKL